MRQNKADRRQRLRGYLDNSLLVEVKPQFVDAIAVQQLPWLGRFVKRGIDIIGSIAAMLVLSPVLLLTALAIKLDSHGPIFFSQIRVTEGGRLFRMWKFRSMVVNAENIKSSLAGLNEVSGPVFKMTRDPRVTRVGAMIRKLSIDELPQVWNVLKGDMSLVGPRPPIPEEVCQYRYWQARRLAVKGGLTCIWQVSGRSGIPFQEWMRLDLRYVDHWSLLLDLMLLLRTIVVVISGRGAS